jgi:hypothetical protein
MSAVALYMQCFAEQVEDSLVSATDEYNSFLRAPAAIWTIPAQGPLADGTLLSFAASSVTSINWPTTPVATAPSLPNLRGWYYIGCNANLVDASPAVGQPRSLIVYAQQNTGIISGDGRLGAFQDTTLETNTGGENVLPAGTVFFAGGDFTSPNPVDLRIQWLGSGFVGNNPSVSTSPPGRLWAVYLGDTPQIGVI